MDKTEMEMISEDSDDENQWCCIPDSDCESIINLYAIPYNFDDVEPAFDKYLHNGATLEYEGNNAFNDSKEYKIESQDHMSLEKYMHCSDYWHKNKMPIFYSKPKYTPELNLVPGANTSFMPYGELTKRQEKYAKENKALDSLENVPELLNNYSKFSLLPPKMI